MSNYKIDFSYVKNAALRNALPILQRWLPDGKLIGHEYKALNPKRNDKKLGSFSINLNTGKWADFASNDKGSDMIDLTAYLFNITQFEAAKRLCLILGIGDGHNA